MIGEGTPIEKHSVKLRIITFDNWELSRIQEPNPDLEALTGSNLKCV